MSYFLLPNIINTITPDNLQLTKYTENYVISKSLANYLMSMKKQIEIYPNQWEQYKKYTNTYEYVHTNIPFYKMSVCNLKPISRAFYKLIEIFNIFNINFGSEPISSFHLAEGPGGFIEALITYRENNNTINDKDVYYGMTLINENENDNNDNIPGWNKSAYFFKKYSNIKIITGQDKTGDLLNIDNLWYCYNNFKNSMDFITGDGGFDYSTSFNQQEQVSVKLIFAQIVYAIAMQKKHGTFILKVFDIFTQISLELLYILSSLYEKCYIVKPHSSRCANSEKYVYCENFKLDDTYDLINKFSKMFIEFDNFNINTILNFKLQYLYINKIEEINAILGQQQLENILSTLNMLDNHKPDKLESIKKNNILKCIQYCIRNNLPYHKNINQFNMFIN